MVIKSDVRCSYWFCCYRCSVAQLCPVLCDPMDCSTPGSLSFTISQSLLKFMSIESMTLSNHLILCCPLLLPSIFPSIMLCLFQWVSSLDQVANILELQHQSSQWIFRESSMNEYSLGLTGLISLLSKGLSGVFSSTTVQKHQFSRALPSLRSSSYNWHITLCKFKVWHVVFIHS